MSLNLSKLRFIQARNYGRGRISGIKYIVIHTAETSETSMAAENVANYFRTTTRAASAHICVDNNSAVRSLNDGDTAWAAPPCNSNGLHIELAGYARQSTKDWNDPYSNDLLKNTAYIVAQWCIKYKIPVRKLSVSQLKSGAYKGIIGHADVTNAFHKSDHTDPGKYFPWTKFINLVNVQYKILGKPVAKPKPSLNKYPGYLIRRGDRGPTIKKIQQRLITLGYKLPRYGADSSFGEETETAIKRFQRAKKLDDDGIVGRNTWNALF